MKPRPDEIDVQVGNNLRSFRQFRELSQEELSYKLGVTMQQVQKYEKGINRISASRLYKASLALSVNIDDLYNGVNEGAAKKTNPKLGLLELDKDTIKIISTYQKIGNKKIKKQILDLIQSMTEM